MTGAIFRFSLFTIARKTSGSKVLMDLVKATHGPQNIPATDAARTMLMSSQIFIVMVPSIRQAGKFGPNLIESYPPEIGRAC